MWYRIPFIFTTIILCLLAFLTSDLMVMRIIFVACHSLSANCPFIPSDFCLALHICTRHFCIRLFITPSYSLFFFCQFSLLAHFSNLGAHSSHVERSIWWPFYMLGEVKAGKDSVILILGEMFLSGGFLGCKFFCHVFSEDVWLDIFISLRG